MKSGITDFKDFAEFVSYIVASVSLGGIFYSYIFSKKQIHFSTMEKCTTDFRNIVLNQYNTSNEDLSWQYIDLVNEEFFYLEQNYLPLTVCIEWIDGMIEYLPFYTFEETIQPSNKLSILNDEAFLNIIMNDYPRVRRAISLNNHINFDFVHLFPITKEDKILKFKERNKLIYNILINLKIGKLNKYKLRSKIKNR